MSLNYLSKTTQCTFKFMVIVAVYIYADIFCFISVAATVKVSLF